ncbi:unnamed protein product [Rangifer tarandus platyrhynchus]|uniref:Ankyrin repeat domain-containing protein 26-like n=1 Tax=Rangifer tarandus platyrhynchus TaxID=3082113 RepID=A0ABN8XYP7_RANTA|nr:unnamed protein product [Rangifer tarandus platyrhynchus]
MKKIFGFRSKKGLSPFGPSISLGRDRGHHKTSFQPWYHIRDKDLRKIHKAASVGNVAKVQQVLLLGENGLNEKDKMNRTALHLACANGHSAVVALLLERKCLLNLCDSENKTALMKAVECQEEECATLLLEHGADPNVRDACGNTALHYAVFGQNMSLAAKLLSYDAHIEARNKNDLTPLLLAISERQQQMVEFLVEKEANIHAVDKMKRTALILAVNYESMSVVSLLLQRGADVFSRDVFGRTAEEYASLSGFNTICQLISEYKEKRPKTPPEKSNPVDTSSEEDSLSRFSNKPGADLWPLSDDEVLDFETKHVPKANLAKLLKAFQQSKRNEAECGIARRESTTFSENNNSDSDIEDVLETFPKPSPGVQGFPHPAFPRPDPLPKPLETPAGLGLAQEGATKPELVEKESDTYIIERAPQEQANHDHLTSVDRAHKNNKSDIMSAVGLGEEENTESPWDSESISESVPQKFVDHLSGDQRGNNTLNGQTEGVSYMPSSVSGLRKFKMAELEEPRHAGIPAAHVESPEKYPNVKPTVGVEDSVPNKTVGTKDPQTSNSGELDVEVILEEEQEKLHGNENNHSQVEEEKKHKSSEVEVSDDVCDAADESRLIQQRKSGGNNKREFPAMENKGSDGSEPGVPRKEIEKKNNDKWTPEECVIAPVFEKIHSLTDGLLQVNDDSILRKVDQDDSRPARKTAYEKKKVSDSGRKAKGLLRKYHMLQDEIASLRLEIDAVKNQNRENEKKYSEDIENLQQAMKSKEEIFTQAIFQYTGQLTVLRAENTMLNSELENNRQSRHRLETEVESCRSRLAAAIHDHEQGQTSQRDLELAFQKAHDERLCLQDQMKCHGTKLKRNSETASQQLPKVESQFNKLKMKPHQTRDDLRGKTLMSECVQRDLHQAECQKQEIEHMDQNEQGKVNEYLGKQESLEERLSQLQSENMLLRQHLDEAQNKADSKETIISIQDQFQQMVKNLHAESEKQHLMLEERNKELINKLNHLEERMCQDENEEAEEADMRQLWQELADGLKTWSMSEAALEGMARNCANLEDEIQDLKSKFRQLPSQLQESQDQHIEAVRCAEKPQDHIQRLEIENAKLQTTVKKQVDNVEQLQKTLSSTRLTDHLPAELGAGCSQCLHLDAIYQVLQRELLSMKGWQRKCEKLEKESRKLEQEVVKLQSYTELKMIEHTQVEQYKWEIEERARQDFIEKLKEVNLFFQTRAECQEILEQFQEGHIASIRSQMELRIKDLESEISRTKTFQDYKRAEMEKYKKLYLEELKVRKSLENELDKNNERLAEMSTKLEVEKQRKRSLLSTLSRRSVLEPSSVGIFNPTSGFNANLISGANVGFSTSIPRCSNDSVESFLTKVSSVLFFSLDFRFLI